ncbi:uncharacterized protein SOCEGT47_022560 [Sorangium cellulosum]|uniref:Uncharacterized protein n=1 Tax=Sorangium cellulosum TaxID=56 RepID=A0A4P2PY60_SORCE|nr:DUF3540 domain-containing protein [Sorangium cellulosum]AUX21769.1 uncharacterized protein SOCEGT47_022560 [Sorangium cellulosum]
MRSNVARKVAGRSEPEAAYQEAGRVVRAAGGAFVVASGRAEVEARRAVSCLVEPVAGDVVLLSVLIRGMPASRLTSVSLQNGTNCPGVRVVPSQVKVLLLAP